MSTSGFLRFLACIVIAGLAGYTISVGMQFMSMRGSLNFWGGLIGILVAAFVAIRGIAKVVNSAQKKDQTNPYVKGE